MCIRDRCLERTVSDGGVWTGKGVVGDTGALAGRPSGIVESGDVGVSWGDEGEDTIDVLPRRFLRGNRGRRWLDLTDRWRMARRGFHLLENIIFASLRGTDAPSPALFAKPRRSNSANSIWFEAT